MTPEEVYTNWYKSLKSPDESIFYYHKGVERILLSLVTFVISSSQIASKLGKAEMLRILHVQVPDLIIAWIDEDEETFATLFQMIMIVSEGYAPAAMMAERKYATNKKAIRTMAYLFVNACGACGDMSPELADELIEDLSTDGIDIYSDKIKKFGEDLLFLTRSHGVDIPPHLLLPLIGIK